jgi:hypothetical protein
LMAGLLADQGSFLRHAYIAYIINEIGTK